MGHHVYFRCNVQAVHDLSLSCFQLSGALIEDVAKNDAKMCLEFEEIFTQLSTLKDREELSS